MLEYTVLDHFAGNGPERKRAYQRFILPLAALRRGVFSLNMMKTDASLRQVVEKRREAEQHPLLFPLACFPLVASAP